MSTAHWQARRLPIPAAWPVRSRPAVHPWAIISAGLAPVLLTGAYLIAGIFQPASYSPLRKTISVMAGQAGTDRWIMTGGLFLVGGCYLVTAAGLTGARAAARALLVVAGLAGIGIAASPEPASGATPRHLAWTVLGAVTTAVWPVFAARRASPRPLILTGYGSAAVTVVFVALLGWLLIETRDGSVLGLAERLTSSVQTCWPFVVAVTLRRTRRRPGLVTGGSGGVTDGAAARAGANRRSPEPGAEGAGHSPPAPRAGARNQETPMALTDPWPGQDDDTDYNYYDTPSGNIWRPGGEPGQPPGDQPGRPDTGPYEVIHLGGQAAVVVPVTYFLRLRALELHASAGELQDAEDATPPRARTRTP
jgi:hypothetical membrane protein